MLPLHHRFANLILRLFYLAVFACSALAHAQLVNVDQQLEVTGLPFAVSHSPHSSDVLATSLATIIHNSAICCGRDSALEDSLQKADPKSLQDVAAKLNGRHLLGDGRPITVNTEFFSPDRMNAGYLVTTMTGQKAGLMEWNSHIYIVHGIIYFWQASGTPDAPAGPIPVIHKFLLSDTRYSDSRREVVFNRDTDDLDKVQGFLFLQVKSQ